MCVCVPQIILNLIVFDNFGLRTCWPEVKLLSDQISRSVHPAALFD